MAESDGQERTEQATPKRLQESKEKGQVPRSKELGTVATLLTAAGMFIAIGDNMLTGLADLLVHNFTLSREEVFDSGILFSRFLNTVIEALSILAPFFIMLALAAVVASIALGGWNFSAQAMSFKWDKLDPVKGLGRVFSWRGLVEMFKGLAKFVLVATAAILLLSFQGDHFLALGGEPLPMALAHTGDLLTWSFLAISSVLLLVVAIDVPFQLWDHARQLKMTRQEVKEEGKQTEGSPEVKGKQRRLQMEVAQRRMMEEVPKADVVVTNPTHYAVALRYDQEAMGAPVVVAKGADLIAQQIRSIAREHQVPVLEAPPLARAIYHSTELNAPIPEGLYRAVAQVLAYVYHLRQGPIYNREGQAPDLDLPIPEEFRRDE